MNEILSPQNAKFKVWSSLLEARGIKKNARALLAGKKLVHEFLEQNPAQADELLVSLKGEGLPTPKHVKTYSLATPLFKELDVMGTKAPLLVVKTPVLEKWKADAPRGIELIVALSDPGNLGALLRSAEAFGVSRIILTEEACSPYLPKALRAGSGANFRLPMASTGPLSEISLISGFGLNMDGEDITKFQWPKDLYLVLGEEGRGIPPALKLTSLSIKMAGQVESLNAMAAASVALFSYRSAWPLN